MPGANETPDDDARGDIAEGARLKYRDRPSNDGRHGEGEKEPNQGYPNEALDPDAQRAPKDPVR
jgi:hypothetical protein